MTTLSTHDTKRGEDVRARIDVLAEIPSEWAASSRAARTLASARRRRAREPAVAGGRRRLAARRASASTPTPRRPPARPGSSTSWTDPDEAFESAMHALVDAVFDDADGDAPTSSALVDAIAAAGWSNSLAAKLLQLTAPGRARRLPGQRAVGELARRPRQPPPGRLRDRRRACWPRSTPATCPPVDETGAAKLLVTAERCACAATARSCSRATSPLPAVGAAAEHVVAFDRGGAITVATRLLARARRGRRLGRHGRAAAGRHRGAT